MKRIVGLLSFVFTGYVVSAQEPGKDYALSLKGDTSWGAIQVKGSSAKLKQGEGVINLKPAMYTMLYVAADSALYLPVEIPDLEKKEWCRVITQGVITLYEFKVPNNQLPFGGGNLKNKSTYWIASKNGGPVQEVKSDNMWGSRKDKIASLTKLMEDNPALVQEINEMKDYEQETILGLIRRYNQQAAEKKAASK